MRSPCQFSRRDVLTLSAIAVLSCESDPPVAAVSGETQIDPARDTKPSRPEPDQTPMLTIAIYDEPQPDTPPTDRNSFSIASTRDLYVYSIWSALEGEHFELRQFYAPSGRLYYQKLIPFSTDIDEPYPFTQAISIPHANTIQPVMPNERGNIVVRDQLTLASTSNGGGPPPGMWRIDVSLDGAKTPTLAQRFELVP
jgi:hypothetical protein